MARKRKAEQTRNEITSDAISMIDLRPKEIAHSFPKEPRRNMVRKPRIDRELQWREFKINNSTNKGKGIFIKECFPGFLIPYGGEFISEETYRERMKSHKKRSENPELDYLYRVKVCKDGEIIQNGYFDANPALLLQTYRYKWPGAYCNEIAETDGEFYNSRLFLNV